MNKRFIYAIGYESDEDADCIVLLEAGTKYSQEQFNGIIEAGIDEILERGNLSEESEWYQFIEPLTVYLKGAGFKEVEYQAEMVGHDHWPVRE